MAFDFPASPSEGQTFTPAGGPSYVYQAPRWLGTGTTVATTSGYRNRIINGDFSIDQRNVSAGLPVASGSTYTLDRWDFEVSGTGVITIGRYTDPLYDGEYTMIFSVNTADASLAAGDLYLFGQRIEGLNIRDAYWGTTNAKSVTLSFEINSNAAGAGSYPISITNSAGNRSWLGSFTVPSTTGYTKISLTIPGDTTGTWLKTNGVGLNVFIGLGVGSTFQGVAGWQAGAKYGLASMTNYMAAASQFIIRNFQLELGSVATEFERVPYDEQLARCQRYYQQTSGTGGMPRMVSVATGGSQFFVQVVGLPVTMRVGPTTVKAGTWATTNCSQPAIYNSDLNSYSWGTLSTAGGVVDVGSNSADDIFTFSAEL
jgi:hypothetical protein